MNVWRVTATFADGTTKVRYRRSLAGARKLVESFSTERIEETWGFESHEQRFLPAAVSVTVEVGTVQTWEPTSVARKPGSTRNCERCGRFYRDPRPAYSPWEQDEGNYCGRHR